MIENNSRACVERRAAREAGGRAPVAFAQNRCPGVRLDPLNTTRRDTV